MSTASGPPVVVGVDGSERALSAVRFAAAEAVSRHRPLHVVHAFVWPSVKDVFPPGVQQTSVSSLHRQAEGFLTEATDQARKAAPAVTVGTELVDGTATPVLLRASRHAAVLVLGHRGLGGFSGLVLGSVAVQAVTHARCPVLIVRGETRADGPVVAGVDGSPTSVGALAFAAEEADLRRSELIAVHTWTHPVSSGPGDMLPLVYDPAAVSREEHIVLGEAVAAVAGTYPDVRIREQVSRGPAAKTLTEWSRRAQLLVVGARGRGGFAGLLLGSVSQHLVYYAECPTAVVRADLPPA